MSENGVCLDVVLSLVKIHNLKTISEANDLIHDCYAKKLHIIVGDKDHSMLVAGEKDGEFFVWDPNLVRDEGTESELRTKNLAGDFNLEWLFKNYNSSKGVQFWVLKVE